MKNKVSVIIPVYNVEKYLRRCLDSVIEQTYHNIEVLLINDGSSDNSLSICEEYAQKDKRIILISQENKGLSGARNTGIDKATGDFLCFVDSDDWIERDFISLALKEINENDVPLIVMGYYNSTDKESRNVHKGWLNKEVQIYDKQSALKALVEDTLLNSHAWDKVFKTQLFENIRFPDCKNFEDIFIMHEIFAKCDKIAISLQPKYHYYIREDSIARNYKCKNILDYGEAEFARLDYLKDHYPELVPLQNTKIMEWLLSYYPKFSRNGAKDIIEYKSFKNLFIELEIKANQLYEFAHENFTNKKFDVMYRVYRINKYLYKVISPIGNEIINSAKKSKYKSQIKAILYRNLEFKKELLNFPQGKKFVLIGLPEYDNIGDVAIGRAEITFLRQFIPENTHLLEITENKFWKYFHEIKKCITPDDVIFIQGGGNFGDQYYDQERLRRKVISNFKSNKIILMPSTYYKIKQDTYDNRYANYYSKRNLHLVARENVSYEIMKKTFHTDVRLTPDIVLYLPAFKFTGIRQGIATCFRGDIESKLTIEEKKYIKNKLFEFSDIIYTFDTCVNMPVPENEQFNILNDVLLEIAHYRLVVTDKLHAMIFCALTGTPCIALGNYNHKIRGVYEWLKDYEYIVYLDAFDNIEGVVDKMLSLKNQYSYYGLEDKFSELINVIKE